MEDCRRRFRRKSLDVSLWGEGEPIMGIMQGGVEDPHEVEYEFVVVSSEVGLA